MRGKAAPWPQPRFIEETEVRLGSFHYLVQAILRGHLTGSLYALVGMGMALIFGVMRIVNFAHGAFMMLGMYAAYVLFDRVGVNPYIGLHRLGRTLLFVRRARLVYQRLLKPSSAIAPTSCRSCSRSGSR